MKRTIYFLFIYGFLLIGCNEAVNSSNTSDAAVPQTWLDKPLPNSQFTLEPIQLLVHASDPSGVSALAFSVNGTLVESIPTGADSQTLVTVQHVWTPLQPGDYLLSFTALSTDGTWGERSEVLIKVQSELLDPLSGVVLDGGLLELPTPETIQAEVVPPTTEPTSAPGNSSTSIPPTPVPTVPPTSIPPTPIPPTSVPPTRTALPDTERPVILELLWDPISPFEDESVFFTVVAEDNVGVTRIDIYFVRQGVENPEPIHTCLSVDICEYEASNGFLWGTYALYAFAVDAGGNQVSTFVQTVVVQEVVE